MISPTLSIDRDEYLIAYGISNEELQALLFFKIDEIFTAKHSQVYERRKDLGFKWFIKEKPYISIARNGVVQAGVLCEGDPPRLQAGGISLQKISKFQFAMSAELQVDNDAGVNNSFPLMVKPANAAFVTVPTVQDVLQQSKTATGNEAPLPALMANAKETFTGALTEAVKEVGDRLLSPVLVQCGFPPSTANWKTKITYNEAGLFWQLDSTRPMQVTTESSVPANDGNPPPPYDAVDPGLRLASS